MWVVWSLLEGEQNTHRSKYGDKVLKKRPPRDCPTWGFIPYTATNPRHYCGCQEVYAERSLIWLSSHRPFQSLTNIEENVSIGLSMGSLIEELEKGLKELKGFATP